MPNVAQTVLIHCQVLRLKGIKPAKCILDRPAEKREGVVGIERDLTFFVGPSAGSQQLDSRLLYGEGAIML